MKNKSAVAVCLACVASGVALFFIAVRPCEPVAQAASEVSVHQNSASPIHGTEPVLIVVPEQTIIVMQMPTKKILAHSAKKTAMVCGEMYDNAVGGRNADCGTRYPQIQSFGGLQTL